MNNSLIMAIGLMLVLEGVMPLLMPQAWRETFKRLTELKDGQLRFVGVMSIVGGLLFIFFSR
ncbi:MAG: DUF2065 domain-containing protein [Methylophilus sp.]